MPRIARFLKEDEPTVYHVISRTALDGLPFKDEDKGRKKGTSMISMSRGKTEFSLHPPSKPSWWRF